MIFKERYNDILKTENDLAKLLGNDYSVINNAIKKVDVLVTGHFGNTVSLNIVCENISPFPLYNSVGNIGFILRALIELFDKERDEPVSISALQETPIRLVFGGKDPDTSCCVGIGHFMKDRFVFTDDLMKLHK